MANEPNGTDPVVEKLEQILMQLDALEDKIDDIIEKVDELDSSYGDGFTYDS